MREPAVPLLEVQNLSIGFACKEDPKQIIPAVTDISFKVNTGEIVAIVGESGSGKSVTAMAITKLLPAQYARYLGGQILLHGQDLLHANGAILRKVRGKKIGYIFQDPATSLNPVFTVSHQLMEMLQLHRPDLTSRSAREAEAIYWLERVGIKEPKTRIKNYPHEFSGGMQQRVMIAMALCAKPDLLIADEPTTALDVVTQKSITEVLSKLRNDLGMSIIFITHNFQIIKQFADRIVVMFRGKIVEQGESQTVLTQPQHPYSQALMNCIPRLNETKKRLATITYANLP